MRFAGKTVLITGAGSGIGRASALAFAREGAAVAVADLDLAAAEETASACPAGQGFAVAADVSRPEDVVRMVDTTLSRFGHIDVFYQNAGVPQEARPVEEIPLDQWQRIIAVNLTALFIGAAQVVPLMKEQRSGVILVTASIAGIRPRPGLSAYVASKGGAIAFVKSLALELAPFGVRANSICPVAVRTPMMTQFGFGTDETEAERRFVATIPLGRLNTPEDCANAALYLASDEAAMVTGVAFELDGGRGI
jgi:3-oxoacyl-[acyl-carrier protein] reductase